MYRRALSALGAVFAVSLAACQPTDRAEDADSDASAGQGAGVGVLDVVARDFAFDAPDQIPSGWTTFRMANAGQQEHFLLLWRLPDGKTFEDYRTGPVAAFSRVWERYASGEMDRAETEQALGAELPSWFFTELEPSGGPALTEPGATSQATVYLEPGTYVMECYVKAPDGKWHSELGMLRELTVTADATAASPPEADARLTLSNYEITASGELTAGTRTVAVQVQEDPEGFMAHDVNLFRLDVAPYHRYLHAICIPERQRNR